MRSGTVAYVIILTLLFMKAGIADELKMSSETGSNKGNSGRRIYEVGFQTTEIYDYSRTARESQDYFGNPIDGETARPIQICIWYPATTKHNDPRMVISEYNFPYPSDNSFIDYISEIQNREIGLYQMLFHGNDQKIFDILNSDAGAVRDAPFVEGEFPLVIYIPDAGRGISENYSLMEYLAARGYIVATTHSIGAFSINPAADPTGLETIARDLEFVISSLKNSAHIDENKIGIIGCGLGADAAMIIKMRNYNISAIACLYNATASYDRRELLESNPFYNAGLIDVPLLRVSNRVAATGLTDLINSFDFSARYLLDFLPDSGVCLTNYNNYSAIQNNPSGKLLPINERSYGALCSYVNIFFDACLKADNNARVLLSADPGKMNINQGLLLVNYIPAKEAPPTEAQFMSIISNPGPDTAAALYRKFKPIFPDHLFFRESAMNFEGYRLLQTGRIQEAMILFELNTEAYPTSANVWDSYGEACLAAEDYQRALENYKMAQRILPSDSTTPDALKTVIESGAAQQIQSIQEIIDQSQAEGNQ